MLKSEFVKLYAEKYGVDKKNAEEQVEKFLDVMKIALSENSEIIFRKFGSFEVKKTKERMVVDPKNQSKKF